MARGDERQHKDQEDQEFDDFADLEADELRDEDTVRRQRRRQARHASLMPATIQFARALMWGQVVSPLIVLIIGAALAAAEPEDPSATTTTTVAEETTGGPGASLVVFVLVGALILLVAVLAVRLGTLNKTTRNAALGVEAAVLFGSIALMANLSTYGFVNGPLAVAVIVLLLRPRSTAAFSGAATVHATAEGRFDIRDLGDGGT